MPVRLAVCLFALALITLNVHADERDTQRRTFKAAYAAIQSGEGATAADKLESLANYPLYPYLRYARIERALANDFAALPPEAVANFLAEYPDLPLDKTLRYNWLRKLAQDGNWPTFVEYYRGNQAAALVCARVSAALVGATPAEPKPARPKKWIRRATDLWLSGHDQPPECDAAFAWLTKHGILTKRLIRQRFKMAIDAHNLSLMRYLAGRLDGAAQNRATRWTTMDKKPDQTLSATKVADSARGRALLVYGLERLARRDAGSADGHWNDLRARYDFDPPQRAIVRRKIALWKARQHRAGAYQSLAALPASGYGLVKQWRVRSALRNGWWHTALKDIATLPAARRNSDQWQYWRARALSQTHHQNQAEAIYARLAQHHGYYGYLAADRIDTPYAIQSQPSQPDHARMRKLAARPRVIRARELFAVGLLDFADDEWRAAISALPRDARCQAGLLANDWGWHAAAIRTLARAGCRDDLKVRYPTAFSDTVSARAQALHIDSAWLYSMIRSESLFAPNAVSYAGALGLMQLMPATGRKMASRLNITLDGSATLLDPAINIRLGSGYLHRVKARFGGNAALATASYNAGPGNVADWLPLHQPLAADVWVETIPFGQTRAYVKRVMAHAVVFAWRLGVRGPRISERMGTIRPITGEPATAAMAR